MALSARARVLLAWLPVVGYTLLIWWLSSHTIDPELLARVPLQDKGVHFLEYAALSSFIAHAVAATWQERGAGATVSAILMASALGLLDELHQAFVPGRSSDPLDLIADTAGALFAACVYAGISRAYRSLSRPRAPSQAPPESG